jgi:hypothetical protein
MRGWETTTGKRCRSCDKLTECCGCTILGCSRRWSHNVHDDAQLVLGLVGALHRRAQRRVDAVHVVERHGQRLAVRVLGGDELAVLVRGHQLQLDAVQRGAHLQLLLDLLHQVAHVGSARHELGGALGTWPLCPEDARLDAAGRRSGRGRARRGALAVAHPRTVTSTQEGRHGVAAGLQQREKATGREKSHTRG